MLDNAFVALARDFLEAHDGVAPFAEVTAHVAEGLDGALGEAIDRPDSIATTEEQLRQATSGGGPLERVGDRLVDIVTVVDGVRFTHRITEEERSADVLALDADLGVFARIAEVDGGLHRRDGEPLRLRLERVRGAGLGGTVRLSRSLVGPAGWLSGLTAGSVVAVSATNGYVDVEAIDEPAAGDDTSEVEAVATRVQDALDAALLVANSGDDVPVFVERLQLAGLVDGWHEPTAASPPFGDVLDAAGYQRSASQVGQSGAFERYRQLELLVGVTGGHLGHLDRHATKALTDVVLAFAEWQQDPSVAPDGSLLSGILRHADAAPCLEEELLRADPDGHDLHAFLDLIEAPNGTEAVLQSLKALAADIEGDGRAVLEHLALAMVADPLWFPAVEAMAFGSELSGLPKEAAGLLSRIRLAADPELQVLQGRLRAANPTMGRNDPCPCGSGRKFKQCHQGKSLLPDEVRVAWLLDKARAHLLRVGPLDLLLDLPGPSAEAQLLAEDVALFDRGGLEAFLGRRREWLPAEDIALVERWLAGQRQSVFCVGASGGDRLTVELYDEAAEEAVFVHRTEAFDGVQPGEMVWCRLLPGTAADDEWWCSGLVESVDPEAVDVILAAGDHDPEGRHRAVIGLPEQVRMLASDGKPLMWSVTEWHVGDDLSAATAALESSAFTTVDDRLWELEVHGRTEASISLLPPLPTDHADEYEAQRAAMDELDEGTTEESLAFDLRQAALLCRTDSVPRHEAAKALVQDLLPAATLAWEHLVPAARHRSMERVERLYAELEGYGADYDWDELDDDEV